MSRGGGSRGGGGANSGVRAIANVLGITRQEANQFTQQQVRNEPLPLFPPLARVPLPLEENKELIFMTDAKQEFLHRFRESSFYHKRAGKRDVRRYTDKYRIMDKEPFEPQWDRLPAELNWKSKPGALDTRKSATKRSKMDEQILLDKLGEREKRSADKGSGEMEEEEGRDRDGDEEEAARPHTANEDEEEVAYSDEDYLAEGANDYVDTYFDAGEDYEEDGNALEDEGVY